MKFNVELKTEVSVQFSNPEAAYNYFIKDTGWRDYFYRFDDLKELAEFLSQSILYTLEQWHQEKKQFYRDIEGFPLFMKDGETFTCSSEEFGDIIVCGDEYNTYVEWCIEEK